MNADRTGADTAHGGYRADVPYPIAFQAAQTPAHLALVCALAGVAWRPQEPLNVADLGCGRGYVVNTLAAANPGWTLLGLDHAPAPVAEARQTAALAGLGNAHFQEADLGRLSDAELDALPALDVVMLHGVWTWVSDAVRAGVLRLLQRRLKPGGLVYVGYNAQPAAGADGALQRLLCHLAGPFGAGESEAAAVQAIAHLRQVAPALPLARTPMLQRLLADPPQLTPSFVAHEFLTRHWRPVFHEDLCAALAPAKLQFVGSSNLFEALPGLYAQPEQLALMRGLPPGEVQELMKDLCLPRSFRADVFVRGARPVDSVAALDALVLAAQQDLPQASPALATGTAQAVLSAPVWAVLRAALGEGPQALGALRTALTAQGLSAPHPAELLAVLVGTGQALPLLRQPARTAEATRFNQTVAAQHARGGAGAGHFALASAAAGGGLPADALDLALVAALLQGQRADDPQALATALGAQEQAVTCAATVEAPDPPAIPGARSSGSAAAVAPAAVAHADLAQRIATRLPERLPVWRRFGVL